MNTPADKPDLPAPDDIDYRMGKDDVHWYHADTVRRLLADERRKAWELAARESETFFRCRADLSSTAHVGHYEHAGRKIAQHFRALIDRKEPT